MTTRPVILLDDGGVINDNRLRGQQWPALVGEFFAPRLGGTLATWAEANRLIMQSILAPASWQRRVQAASDYPGFEYTYRLDWVRGIAQHVGVPLPSEQECVQLAQQAENECIPRVRAAFPGACEAIKQLYSAGYTLHTASSGSSVQLAGHLEGMGVRHCFGRLYGADLLNTLKEGPEFYIQLFADLQITPGEALIVDDSPRVLNWARSLGAHTVLVGAVREPEDGMPHIHRLAELPAFLQRTA